MKRVLSSLLIFAGIMFLTSCSWPEADSQGIELYYPVENGSGVARGSLGTEVLEYDQPDITLEFVIENLLSGPKNGTGLYSPFIDGLRLIEWDLTAGTATLMFSGEYGELKDLNATLVSACITLTLLQFDNITGIAITWEGRDESIGVFTEDSFDFNERQGSSSERLITLYYLAEGGRFISADTQTLVIDESGSVERFVIEELIRGPKNPGMEALFPENTELINISTDKRICYVDLSSAFYEKRPDDPIRERLLIYSIVNSLTEISGIEAVQFLVEGEALSRYSYMDISVPLTRYEQVIWSGANSYDHIDVSVYVRRRGDEFVTELPAMAQRGEFSGVEQLVIETLLDLSPPQGCDKLFADGTEVVSLAVREGICYLDLTDEFLMGADEDSLKYKTYAIVASLTELGSVTGVQLLVNGDVVEDAPFDISSVINREDIAIG